MKVVIGVAGALALGSGHVALAEPRLEASGFVGIDYFGDNIELGNSWAAEQIPGTSVLLGGRLLWVALPALATPGGHPLALGVEGEVAISPASTGDLGGIRMAYFAPVFGWHAHAMLRLGLPTVRPHLVLGAGGETVASTSPFMTKETDPVVYWGLGASSALSPRWQLRLDLRHGIMPARDGAATSTLEFQIGVGATFGLPRKLVRPTAPPPPPHQPRIDETDTDEDGLPDWLDNCPRDAETVNGIADEDGCPETDPDNDGLVGDADACPADAEDLDGFEDGDGCPDADNDRDGILDVNDTCPDAPETRNGFVDDDGCPDEVAPAVVRALATAAKVKFEGGRARIADAAKRELATLVMVLTEHPELQITITGHPDRANAPAEDLARRRAEAVKWYLVDQGLMAARFTTQVGAIGKVAIDVVLVVSAPPNPPAG